MFFGPRYFATLQGDFSLDRDFDESELEESVDDFNAFHEEIIMRWGIFRHLSPEDLGRCAPASRTWRAFTNDERLWKMRLMENFYFSSQAVERLQSQLSFHYKEVYRYCVQYQLKDYQQLAVQQLTSFGVTREHLCGRDWFDSSHHLRALTLLITNDQLMPVDAINELDHLNEDQALALSVLFSKGLRAGLFREEQYLFFHEYQLKCLCCLVLQHNFDLDTAIAIFRYMNLQIAANHPYDPPQYYYAAELEYHMNTFIQQSPGVRI